MLALAFTAHLPPASEAVASPPAVTSVASPTVMVAEPAPQPVVRPVAVLPALPPATPAVIGAAILLLLVGRFFSVRGERAPPFA